MSEPSTAEGFVDAAEYTLKDMSLFTGDGDEYILHVADLPSGDKPREKLQRLGPSSLELYELLAILIGRGTRKEDVLSMSRRIVKQYGEQTITNEHNPRRLAEALDIPPTKAMQVVGRDRNWSAILCPAGRKVVIHPLGRTGL